MTLQARSEFGAACGRIPLCEQLAPSGSNERATQLIARGDVGTVLISSAVAPGEIVAPLRSVTGAQFPAGPREPADTDLVCARWLTPRSWLIHCHPDDEFSLASRINASFGDRRVHAVPAGDGLSWVELSGGLAEPLLAEGGFISLESDGLSKEHTKRTLFAAVPVLIARERDDAWLIGVERSRVRYLAEWFTTALARAGRLEPIDYSNTRAPAQ
jgi:heterotetrameric sarcosine oxidase gamma subunit